MKIITLLIGTIIALGNPTAFADVRVDRKMSKPTLYALPLLSQQNENNSDGLKRINLNDVQSTGSSDRLNHWLCSQLSQMLQIISTDSFLLLSSPCRQWSGSGYILTNIRALILPPDFDNGNNIDDTGEVEEINLNDVQSTGSSDRLNYWLCSRMIQMLQIISTNRLRFVSGSCQGWSGGGYILQNIKALILPADSDKN